MSRQAINRIILGLFIIVFFIMGMIYVKQERKMQVLKEERERLAAKCERIEYVIDEYTVLIDSMNSKNFVIRMARDMFGWVFDNETIYKKTVPEEPEETVLPEVYNVR